MQYFIFHILLTLKKSILAALAATSLHSAMAAVSPPLSELPPEFSIAMHSIQQELDRRAAPGKGKPIKLDQPSDTAPTPQQKAALRAVFGTEQPLEILRSGGAGKVTQYTIKLPAGQYQLDDNRIAWSSLPLLTSVDAASVSSSGLWPHLEFHGLDYNAVFKDMRINSRQQRDSLLGTVSVDIGSVRIDDLTPDTVIQSNGVSYRQTLAAQGKKLEQQYELSSKRISLGSLDQIDDLHLALRLRGLSAEAWQSRNTERQPSAADQLLPAALRALLLQGAELELRDYSYNTGGGRVQMRGTLSLPGATLKDMASKETILNALQAHLHLEISTSAMRAMVLMCARIDGGEHNGAALEKRVRDSYAFMLGKLLSEGYATLDKDKLVSEIDIKQGKVRIHQHPKLLPLSALLEKMSAPAPDAPAPVEEDHSPPVAVLWRDRSEENLQLFAGNGEKRAARELCLRRVQAQDAEQAERWCKQADMAVPAKVNDDRERRPELKDNTFHQSVKAGQFGLSYYRFDATKSRRLQLTLSNPQKHEQWVPSMRVCVQAEAPSDKACFEVAKYSSVDTVKVGSSLRGADGRERGKGQVLERTFKVGEPITLDIMVDDQQVHFLVGDGDNDELVEDITFPVAQLELFCSGADCAFKFE